MSPSGEALPREQQPGSLGRAVDRGFTAAFELVMTPALFGFIGYLIDRRLGTGPILTIALASVVTCYVVWKLWYKYTVEMTRLEAELIARRSGEFSGTEQ